MPTYDYKCPDCGYKEEVTHSLTWTLDIVCPACTGSGSMVRVFSAPATVFKGQGFASNER